MTNRIQACIVVIVMLLETSSGLLGQQSFLPSRRKQTTTSTYSPTYTFTETFDANPGYDNTWSENIGTGGAVDEDYTPALNGTHSLRTYGGTGGITYARYNTSSLSELWLVFRIKFIVVSVSDRVIIIYDSSGNALCYVQYHTAGVLRINDGTIQADTTATTSTGTEYFLWVHYKAGSGADGVCEVHFSTTKTKPADGSAYHAKLSTSAKTANVGRVFLVSWIASTDIVFDDLKFDDTEILSDWP